MDITLSITTEQAERIRNALRYKYASDEQAKALTNTELAKYHILTELRRTVLDNERSIAENQMLGGLNKEF